MSEPRYLENIRARMDAIDVMPPGLRALVHEHGFTVVNNFIECGVTDHRRIAHLIRIVREGSMEKGNRYVSPDHQRELDGYLFRRLGGKYSIVPKDPTAEMVQASIDALRVCGYENIPVTKTLKHTLRLKRALKTGHDQLAKLLMGDQP